MLDDVGRGRFGAMGDEDSLLSHVELAAGAVSSILRDSNLKKVECDAPNPGGLLTTRQPAKNLYVSYHETHT